MTIKRTNGVAGQYQLTATTPDGTLTFVGSEYGGPIVMITPTGAEIFVSDPGRFGAVLDPEWIRQFLAG